MHLVTSRIIQYPLNRQEWDNPGVTLAAFWAKQEIKYLEDLDLTPSEDKKKFQIAASLKVRYLKIVLMQS